MKNKLFIAMILIYFGLAGNALAWQTEFIAQGRLVSGITNIYSVIIGEANIADILPSAPATPQFTTLLYIKSTPDNLYKDVRISGTSPQIWTFFIDPHGNVGIPDSAFESILTWDPSTFDTNLDVTYKLIAGENGTGNVLIEDMRSTTSFTFSGAENEGVFVSVVVGGAPPPCQTEQSITLIEGWNMISSYLSLCPLTDMKALADPITNDLIKIVDNEGNSLVNFFGNWMNNIGDFADGQGYRVKVNSDTVWTLKGDNIQLPESIPLFTGWNMPGYPCDTAQDAMTVIQPLIDNECLEKVVDNEGNSIVNFFNSWLNKIGDFQPGQGYRIKMTCSDQLIINEPAKTRKRSRTRTITRTAATHYTKVWFFGAVNPMSIYVIGATINDNPLSVGDEIAVFDNDKCVGVSVVESEVGPTSPLIVISSKDDGTGNGYTPGNPITIKIWDGQTEYTDDSVEYFDLTSSPVATPSFTPDGDFAANISVEGNSPPDSYCNKVWDGGAVTPMTFYVIGVPDSIAAGDEIVILDGNKHVGCMDVTGAIGPTSPLIIITSKDDGSGNGFTPGNTITFHIWDSSEQTVLDDFELTFYDLSQNPVSQPDFTPDADYAVTLEERSDPPPEITAISPNSGNIAGDLDVTISGTNFTDGLTVSIGGVNAPNVVVNSSTEITCKTPSHEAGIVDVVVTNPDSNSGTLENGFEFTELSGYCNKVWGGGAVNPMSLYIIEVPDYVEAGDEIIVKDGDKHVGCKEVTGEISPASPLIVISSKDDGSGNGYIPGHTIEICIWDVSEQQLKCPGVINYSDLSGNPIIPPPPFTPDADYAVQIEENVKPVIILIPDNPYEVKKCTVFTDPGATASDPNDGDISGDIVVQGTVDTSKVGEYTLTYTVINTSGVAADPKTRVVNVIDTTDPVITISGANPMIIAYCATFNDPGATANDPNCNTDLTDQIIIEGSVDSCTPGTYEITYTVSDDAGNTVSITRTVTVLEALKCDISINPTSKDFGTDLCDPTTQLFTISNSGDGACDIDEIVISGNDTEGFSIVQDNCSNQTVDPSQTCTLNVTFSPALAPTTVNTGSLDIPSNDPDTPTLAVSLEGSKADPAICRHFPEVQSTDKYFDMLGTIYDCYSGTISDGDEVAAFVDDGNNGELIIGWSEYGSRVNGKYGFMQIYIDDVDTPEKDGAVSGDVISINVWDKSKGIEYRTSLISGNNIYTTQEQEEICDWKLIVTQVIPLIAGWNQVSFGVNVCYYVGDIPSVSMLKNIKYVQVNSIADVFVSLNGQFSSVKGYDADGGHTYINNSIFGTMKYVAAGYGYWIKVNEDANFDDTGHIYLEIEGTLITANQKRSLHENWNLVGYWGDQIMYKGDVAPDVFFAQLKENNVYVEYVSANKMPSISQIFLSIDNKYDYIKSFDGEGNSYSTEFPEFSDLKYVGPGYGYWINVIQSDSAELHWDPNQ
jgi:hypothetical protein